MSIYDGQDSGWNLTPIGPDPELEPHRNGKTNPDPDAERVRIKTLHDKTVLVAVEDRTGVYILFNELEDSFLHLGDNFDFLRDLTED